MDGGGDAPTVAAPAVGPEAAGSVTPAQHPEPPPTAQHHDAPRGLSPQGMAPFAEPGAGAGETSSGGLAAGANLPFVGAAGFTRTAQSGTSGGFGSAPGGPTAPGSLGTAPAPTANIFSGTAGGFTSGGVGAQPAAATGGFGVSTGSTPGGFSSAAPAAGGFGMGAPAAGSGLGPPIPAAATSPFGAAAGGGGGFGGGFGGLSAPGILGGGVTPPSGAADGGIIGSLGGEQLKSANGSSGAGAGAFGAKSPLGAGAHATVPFRAPPSALGATFAASPGRAPGGGGGGFAGGLEFGGGGSGSVGGFGGDWRNRRGIGGGNGFGGGGFSARGLGGGRSLGSGRGGRGFGSSHGGRGGGGGGRGGRPPRADGFGAPSLTKPPPDKSLDTALHSLCRETSVTLEQIATVMKSMNPDLMVLKTAVNRFHHGGETALHLLCSNASVSPDMITTVTKNMTPDMVGVQTDGDYGGTALHFLSKNPSVTLELFTAVSKTMTPEMVSLKTGNGGRKGGETALALLCSNTSVTVDLVSAAAKTLAPEAIGEKTAMIGETALHRLCKNPSVTLELVIAITKTMTPDMLKETTYSGATALHLLCLNPSVTSELITVVTKIVGAETLSLVTEKSHGGRCGEMTALHYLCLNPSVTPELISIVTKSMPSEMAGLQAGNGETALHCLYSNTSVTPDMIAAVAKAMTPRMVGLDTGLDMRHLQNSGRTVLHVLCANASVTVELMITATKNMTREMASLMTGDSKTALHVLCSNPSVTFELITVLTETMSLEDPVGLTPEERASGRTALKGMEWRAGGQKYLTLGVGGDTEWAEMSEPAECTGKTALHWLCSNTSVTPEMYTAVASYMNPKMVGNKTSPQNEYSRDGEETALHMLCSNPAATAELIVAATKTMVPELTGLQSGNGDTALHRLCKNPSVSLETWTILWTANNRTTMIKNNEFDTPLLSLARSYFAHERSCQMAAFGTLESHCYGCSCFDEPSKPKSDTPEQRVQTFAGLLAANFAAAPASTLVANDDSKRNVFGLLSESQASPTIVSILDATIAHLAATADPELQLLDPAELGDRIQLLLQGCAEAGHELACRHLVEAHHADPDTPSKADPRVPRAIGIGSASLELQGYFERVGAFLGRYILNKGPPIHISKTCMVLLAVDLGHGGAGSSSRLVALKLMRNKAQFVAEVLNRHVGGRALSTSTVVGVLGWHIPGGDATAELIAPSGAKQEPERTTDPAYPFVLAMIRGERSLHDACNKERIAGYNLRAVSAVLAQVAVRVADLHANGVVHGDLKQRNIIRAEGGAGEWLLCDMDAAAQLGHPVGRKTSAAYCPPELARIRFGQQLAELAAADPSFDVWSLGVILFELLTGHTLLQQDTANDELVLVDDKIRLCAWHTISDADMADVLATAEPRATPEQIADGKHLIRWCLKGDPSARPTIAEVLGHPFMCAAVAAASTSAVGAPTAQAPAISRDALPVLPMLYHTFLSHAQMDAAGVVATLFFEFGRKGMSSWLDMHQDDLTLPGMLRGIENSDCFLLVLTENVLKSWFCQQEILKALELQKPIQLVLEEDPRLGAPFGRFGWRASESYQALDPGTCGLLEHMLEEHLPSAIVFRRRDFEAEAMIRELCLRRGNGDERLTLQLPTVVDQPTPQGGQPDALDSNHRVKVFFIRNPDTTAEMAAALRDGLRAAPAVGWLLELVTEPAELASAGMVLVLLTAGVLAQGSDSLAQLEACIAQDAAGLVPRDRLAMVYSVDSWSFAGVEKQTAPAPVQDAINAHEAVTYRAPTADGNRHEFPAMLRRLLLHLGVPARPAERDASPIVSEEVPEAEARAREIAGVTDQLASRVRQVEIAGRKLAALHTGARAGGVAPSPVPDTATPVGGGDALEPVVAALRAVLHAKELQLQAKEAESQAKDEEHRATKAENQRMAAELTALRARHSADTLV